MFEVTSMTRFHSAMLMFVPMINSVIDRCRRKPWKRHPLPGNVR